MIGRELIYSRFDSHHPADVFELSEVVVPEQVRAKEVLVKVKCSPVHPCDIDCFKGLIHGVELPAVGGLEALAVVEKVGIELKEYFSPGQRVHVSATHIFGNWQTWQGVWRDYLICPPEALVPVPDEIDDVVAAQLFVNVLTPFAICREMEIGGDDVLLQTAAGSVLGQVMIQLGKIYGFTTVNLVRRPETARKLSANYSLDTVFVYDGSSASEDLVRTSILNKLENARIGFAIESVSGKTGRLCLDLLGPHGLVYFLDALSGDTNVKVDVMADLAMKNNTLKGWSTQENWLRRNSDEIKRRYIDEVWQLILDRRLVLPPVGEIFPLEQAKAALAASCKVGKAGKVILVCSEI